MTEARAKELGYEVKVGHFPFIGNGKAIALGEPEGMIKTVFDAKTGEMLGAHMVGAEVTELIQGYVIGRKLETTEVELMDTVFPHPTLERDDARGGARRLRQDAAHVRTPGAPAACRPRRGFLSDRRCDERDPRWTLPAMPARWAVCPTPRPTASITRACRPSGWSPGSSI